MDSPTLQTHIRQYIHELQATGTTTHANYSIGLNHFLTAKIPLNDDCLRAFDEWLFKQQRYRPGTRDLYVIALRQFLIWLNARDLLPPTLNYPKAEARFKTQRGRRRTNVKSNPRVADPNLNKLISYFDDAELPTGPRTRLELLRNRALVHTLFSTGARISELTTLTREAVANGHLTEVQITGKGHTDRIIFISQPARTAITAYLKARDDDQPGLFISHRGRTINQPLTAASAWRIIKVAGLAIGLANNTSPHMVRHWVATDMLNRGTPLEIVQEFLGHKDIKTTRRIYAITNISTLRMFVHAYQSGQDWVSPQLRLPLENKKADDL